MRITLSALILLAGGCILPSADYTHGDAQSFTMMITNQLVDAMNTSGMRAALSTQATHQIDVPISATSDCPRWGHASFVGSVTGTWNDQTGDATYFTGLTISVVSCAMAARDGTVTTDGDPYLTVTGTELFHGGQPEMQQEFDLGGGWRWHFSGGPSGSCNMNVTFLASAYSGYSHLSGMACGHAIDEAW